MKLLLAQVMAALVAYGPWGILLIGVVDSIGIPLPATLDALLILFAAKVPGQAYFAATLAVLGSLAGNLALFHAARYGSVLLMRSSAPDKSGKLSAWFRRYGLITIFFPAATPIVPLPLKVFVVSAGAWRTPWAKFLAVILAARTLRYFGEAYVGVKLGLGAPEYLQHHKWTLLAVVLAVAFLSYRVIQSAGRRSAGSVITVSRQTESVEPVS